MFVHIFPPSMCVAVLEWRAPKKCQLVVDDDKNPQQSVRWCKSQLLVHDLSCPTTLTHIKRTHVFFSNVGILRARDNVAKSTNESSTVLLFCCCCFGQLRLFWTMIWNVGNFLFESSLLWYQFKSKFIF